MKKILIFIKTFLFLLIAANYLIAQEKEQDFPEKRPLPISISYFGNNLFYPGLKVSLEGFPFGKERIQRDLEAGRVKVFKFMSLTSIGSFVVPRTQTSLFLNTEAGMRLTFRNGLKMELFTGLGYMRVFNAGKTYKQNESGGFDRVFLAGRNYIVQNLTYGFGWDLFNKKGKPLSFHIRPSLYFLVPYNTLYNVLINVEIGATYFFRNIQKN